MRHSWPACISSPSTRTIRDIRSICYLEDIAGFSSPVYQNERPFSPLRRSPCRLQSCYEPVSALRLACSRAANPSFAAKTRPARSLPSRVPGSLQLRRMLLLRRLLLRLRRRQHRRQPQSRPQVACQILPRYKLPFLLLQILRKQLRKMNRLSIMHLQRRRMKACRHPLRQRSSRSFSQNNQRRRPRLGTRRYRTPCPRI